MYWNIFVVLITILIAIFYQTIIPLSWTFDVPYDIKLKKNLIVVGTETCRLDSGLLCWAAHKMGGGWDHTCGIGKANDWQLNTIVNTVGKVIPGADKMLIFVNRSKKMKQVNMIIDKLKEFPGHFILYMFPEGTTKKTNRWRTGFHHIARKTNADICIVGIDHATKHVCIDSIFTPRKHSEDNIYIIKHQLRKYTLARPKYSNLN